MMSTDGTELESPSPGWIMSKSSATFRSGSGDDRVADRGVGDLIDVGLPALVVLHRVDGQRDDLGVALVPLGLELGDSAESVAHTGV
jgi:hypothetical protein